MEEMKEPKEVKARKREKVDPNADLFAMYSDTLKEKDDTKFVWRKIHDKDALIKASELSELEREEIKLDTIKKVQEHFSLASVNAKLDAFLNN